MRILYVITDAEIGGAEKLLQYLAEAKHEEDHLGLIVIMGEGPLSDEFRKVFDQVLHLDFNYSSRNLLQMVAKFTKAAKQFNPDVISSHLFHADFITALSPIKTPKVSSIHTQKLGEGVHPLTRIIARATGLLSGRFAAVVPTSDSAQMEDFLRTYRYKNVVKPITNVTRIPEEINYSPTTRVFTSIARNHPVKGHSVLFEAFARFSAQFPDWELDLYGPGVEATDAEMAKLIYNAEVEDLVKDGRIRLNGPVSNVQNPLNRSGAFIISSLYGEAFPIVGAEAASYGVPVISTDVGSCSNFVDDNRFLIEPGSVGALARAMNDFAGMSSSDRKMLSVLARDRALENYSANQAYEKYKELYSSLIQS